MLCGSLNLSTHCCVPKRLISFSGNWWLRFPCFKVSTTFCFLFGVSRKRLAMFFRQSNRVVTITLTFLGRRRQSEASEAQPHDVAKHGKRMQKWWATQVQLVGGVATRIEKYAGPIGSSSQGSGWNIKNVSKPPPRQLNLWQVKVSLMTKHVKHLFVHAAFFRITMLIFNCLRDFFCMKKNPGGNSNQLWPSNAWFKYLPAFLLLSNKLLIFQKLAVPTAKHLEAPGSFLP